MRKTFVILIVIGLLLLPESYAVEHTPAKAAEIASPSALNKVVPATVTIIISKKVPAPQAYINKNGDAVVVRDVGDVAPATTAPNTLVEETVGAGSGFLVSHDGYIITNNHVVLDPTADYTVVTADGTEHTATIVSRDDQKDIALIKVAGTFEHVAQLGSSKDLRVGQQVTAIGNAYGLAEHSISRGTISAFNKNIVAGGAGIVEELHGLLQSSTSIVPGYSGGPLIDSQGNVVGMNVAKDSNTAETSFSIPIDVVKASLKQYAF